MAVSPFESVEHWSVTKKSVRSQRGVVAAQSTVAAGVGAQILAAGGNAVDAAVATAFALSVVEPWMCGLGGSGYMVVWDNTAKRSAVYDFQGVLPQHINANDYPLDPAVPHSTMGFPGVVNDLNTVGYQSISVPGAVKGLSDALSDFGTKGLDTLLSPSIALAKNGVAASWFTTLQIALASKELSLDKTASELFLPGGIALQPQQLMKNPALANSLELISHNGPNVMYGGELGQQMAEDLKAGGSAIETADFAAYNTIKTDTLLGSHRGTTLHTAGPTSGGPRLIDTLGYIAEHLDVRQGVGAHNWVVYAKALQQAWHKHSEKIGRATEVGGCTSHLSAVDEQGNMVALTYTLLSRFGSGVMLPGSGILMNNAVSYFDPREGYPTSMAPGKRINASNMCPTIAVKDNQSLLAVGASGANFIMPCTAIITALMLDHGYTLEQAINQPRIDVAENAQVTADPLLGEEVLQALSQQFSVTTAQRLVFPKLFACASGVSRDADTGHLYGNNDPSQPIGGAVAADDYFTR
jgi:gamma-glutamyltranspeptidase/glutathione hydrolase